ncbi:MAG TPA: hypothetical protein EYQ85_04680 [Candidatus Poseidoniales archaeon]|nr:hypothetical protein [Candidatus Poseidoniales archaeon]
MNSRHLEQIMRRGFTWLLLLLLILQPIITPVAAASWEVDGWLSTGYADERLAAGDEFGCYEIPSLSWQADPGAMAKECREYIEENIAASHWNLTPISTFVEDGLTYIEHDLIDAQGFPIHGDDTGLASTAWHNSEDFPEQPEDWYNLGRRGGSLEKEMNTLATVKTEAEAGGLVNFYWIGKVDEITIRHDSGIEEWLLDSDAWFTTWGEAWSTWVIQRCHQFQLPSPTTSAEGEWRMKVERPEACLASEDRNWNVPVTWRVNASDSKVVSVVDVSTGNQLVVLDVSENQLQQGWRMDGSHLLLTIPVGMEVKVVFEDGDVGVDILDEQWFNGRSFAVTIAAHETDDLFTWSKRFEASSDLRFTWLISPRDARSSSPWLPIIGVTLVLGSMLAYSIMIKRDKTLIASLEEE